MQDESALPEVDAAHESFVNRAHSPWQAKRTERVTPQNALSDTPVRL